MEWNRLIRDNQRWLATYCALAKFIGWMLIFFGIVFLAGTIYTKICHPEVFSQAGGFFYGLIDPFTMAILPGLIALVAGAFLHYLMNPDARPEPFLLHGDLILYLAAAVYFIRIIGMLINMPAVYTHFAGWPQAMNAIVMVIIPNLLLLIARIIIAVGLAQGLRRVLAAIQDSKTLV